MVEAAAGGVLWEKVFLKISQNSHEHTCARVSYLLERDSGTLFPCEFCEIAKNTFFTEHLRTTTSEMDNEATGLGN